MTNDQAEPIQEEDHQAGVSKSHEHFNPVLVTDTVGALFLGSISIILMAVVAGLLVHVRRLEARLKESHHSVDQ
jgi:hypothetical protein